MGAIVRVLVIAPEQTGLNTLPEIRQIQRRHHMSVLDGVVTVEDIYQACRETPFDVIHFATHSGPDGVLLSNGVLFTADEIAGVARLKETRCLFFNSCNSSKLASYAVRHGVRYAVHTNISIPDADAWKAAVSFYESLQNGHGKDYIGAYVVADDGDGKYGLSVDPDYLTELQKAAAAATIAPHGAMPMTKQDLYRWGLFFLLASIVLSTILARLAGG